MGLVVINLDAWLQQCEEDNDGWIIGGLIPLVRVILDGVEVTDSKILQVNRKTKEGIRYTYPFVMDENGDLKLELFTFETIEFKEYVDE